jgi:hypothetical protein
MIRALIDRILTVKDAPNSALDREWRWNGIAYRTEDGGFAIGIEMLLTKFRGVRSETPRPVQSWDCGVRIDYLKDLKVSQDHTWYDGPICHYRVGPFFVNRFHWTDCKRCDDYLEGR